MRDLDVNATPAVTIVAHNLTDELLNARIAEFMATVGEDERVKKARECRDRAVAKQQRLRASHQRLNSHVAELSKRLQGASDDVRAALLDGADASPALLQQRGTISTERDGALAAIDCLVRDLIPAAQIESLNAESDLLYAEADAVEALVNDRARRLVELLAEAVDFEGVITVDHTPPTVETPEGILGVDRPSTITGLLSLKQRNMSLRAYAIRGEAKNLAEQYRALLPKK